MKCLVTGATGFTGGHLAISLSTAGHQVRALVRPGSQCGDLLDAGIEIVEGQLTSKDDVHAAARECERIFHIAAVFRTAGHPDAYYHEVNVGGTLNVLSAARAHAAERVVHCSTGGVHGHIEDPPASEGYRFKPDDVYQRSKLEAEMEVAKAARNGQPVVTFRPAAIYGEGDLRFLKLFRSIQQGRFVMVGSGQTRLHMVHIDDLVQGIQLCGERREALGQTYILAGPEAPTLNEIVRIGAAVMHVKPPALHVPVWPVYAAAWLCEMACVPLRIDPPLHRRRVGFFTHHREFDITKARQQLGFAPRISVREGIARTVAWYASQGHLAPLGSAAPHSRDASAG